MLSARRFLAVFLFALAAAGALHAQSLLLEPIRPLPPSANFKPARAALGRILFNEPRLAGDKLPSCAGCHRLASGGADAKPLSLWSGGISTRFNTPTVYNAMLNFRLGWTGGHSTIDGLLDHAIAPGSNATAWELAAASLTGTPVGARFAREYGNEVSAAQLKDALGEYLRSLSTPSRFDRFLRGDNGAISSAEKIGYARFKSYGCASCHQGVNVGGNMYQKFGAMREMAPGASMAADPGRFQLTRREADRHLFRVPSLRNVALTAPYFHNGSVATLDEAVDAMFKYQLGRQAPPQDKQFIIRFLQTLNGEQIPPPGALP